MKINLWNSDGLYQFDATQAELEKMKQDKDLHYIGKICRIHSFVTKLTKAIMWRDWSK